MAYDHTSRPSGIILAGGKSRRMGREKGLIEFDGRPLIAHVINAIEPLCSEIIIVANEESSYHQFGHTVLPDVFPGKGSLGGVFSGLQAAREPFALALACDMPFLNRGLLGYLLSCLPGFDLVIPRARGLSSNTPHSGPRRFNQTAWAYAKESDLHPMHAVYAKTCLPALRKQIQKGDLRLISILENVRTRVVMPEEIDRYDPRHLSFFNMNTPEDLTAALRLRSET